MHSRSMMEKTRKWAPWYKQDAMKPKKFKQEIMYVSRKHADMTQTWGHGTKESVVAIEESKMRNLQL